MRLSKQVFLLLWKNWLLQRKKIWVSVSMIIIPALISFLSVQNRDDVKSGYDVPPFHCKEQFISPEFPENVVIGYTPKTGATDIVMKTTLMILRNIDQTTHFFIHGFMSEEGAIDFYKKYSRYMEQIFVFHIPDKGDLLPRNMKITLRRPERYGYISSEFVFLQVLICQALLKYWSHKEDLEITFQISLKCMADPQYYVNRAATDISASVFSIFLSVFLSVVVGTKMIVYEKEMKMKELLSLMGLSPQAQRIAWFLTLSCYFIPTMAIFTLAFCLPISESGAVLPNSDGTLYFVFLLCYTFGTITFCFMISTFVKKATTGAVLSSVLFFALCCLYMFMKNKYNDFASMSSVVKFIYSFSFNCAIGIGFKLISIYESEGIGAKWSNFNKPPTVDGNFSLLDCMLMLLLDSVIHILIAWYMENVMPGEFGIPKPFYFCFTRSFWNPKSATETIDYDGKKPESDHFERDPTDKIAGIRISDLYKKFGSTIAVNGITLTMYEGQITALLGHNGAGKTTTMFMLTGFTSATRGTAFINNYDVKTNLENARKVLGVCPQHDVLFGSLSVYEHLMFFAMVKGVINDKITYEVIKMAQKVGLEHQMNTLAKNLSGGQKRKLSVAIALIGESKVVILDEPTSGVDPAARRQIWSLLQEARKDRTILLSTHFMDEADALGDRIAIMVEGVVKCCGSPMFLKKLYGSGYHLVVVTNNNCDMPKLTNFIQSFIPNAVLETVSNTEVSYLLPDTESSKFSNLFLNLENEKVKLNIQSFGVSATTMEEVFLKVGETINQPDNKDEAFKGLINKSIYMLDHAITSFNTGFIIKSGFLLQLSRMYGILVKKLHCSWRKCSFFVPLMLMPVLTAMLISWLFKKDISIEHGDLKSVNLDLLPFGETYIPYTDGINPTTSRSDFANLYAKQFGSAHKTELFIKTQNITFDDYTIRRAAELGRDTFNRKMVIGMEVVDVETTTKKVTCIAYYNEHIINSRAISVNYVLNTIYQFFLNDTFSIQTATHPLPDDYTENKKDIQDESSDNLFVTITIMLVTLCMALTTILFMIFPAQEREVGAKDIQTIYGVGPVIYWLPTFLLDFTIYMLAILPFVIIFAIDKLSPYIDDGRWMLLSLVLALYGWAALPHMYAFQFLFKSSSKAVSLGILYNIFTGFFAPYCMAILRKIYMKIELLDDINQTFLVLFPSYTLLYCFVNLVQNYKNIIYCNKSQPDCQEWPRGPCCEGTCEPYCRKHVDDYTNWEIPGIGANLFYMSLQGFLSFLIVMFIEYRVFQWVWYNFIQGSMDDNEIDYAEDEDVAAERQRINSSRNSPSDSLVLYNLHKSYSQLVAVDHVCLGVPELECFGLLGQNGAGKTTIFKMLTGDVLVTGGNAYLKGFDVKNHIRKVQANMGYCPQSDALINLLTGRETLTLFARLRGIPEDKIKMVVERLTESLMISPHIDKFVSQYSGGNKRKLSTAMALIGNPPFIMLDEPSTGMDPEAKRRMWNILSHVRASGSTLLLTSHSMEECEVLCTRLAIMVNGRFMCLGSPQHLKNKFGQGYILITRLNTLEDGTFVPNKPVVDFLTSRFRGVTVFDEHQGYIHFKVLDSDVKLADIFDVMEAAKAEVNVRDYSVHQTTLEQVFLTFTWAQVPPTLLFNP